MLYGNVLVYKFKTIIRHVWKNYIIVLALSTNIDCTLTLAHGVGDCPIECEDIP